MQSAYKAETLNANTTLQSVFCGGRPKRTGRCNQTWTLCRLSWFAPCNHFPSSASMLSSIATWILSLASRSKSFSHRWANAFAVQCQLEHPTYVKSPMVLRKDLDLRMGFFLDERPCMVDPTTTETVEPYAKSELITSYSPIPNGLVCEYETLARNKKRHPQLALLCCRPHLIYHRG